MDTPEFPGNSNSTPPAGEPRKAERVVTSEVKSRRKPMGKRLRDALIGGDSKSALQYAISTVVIPHVKDLLSEAANELIQQLVFGESRGRSTRSRTAGHVNYNRLSSSTRRPTSSVRDSRETITLRRREEEELIFDSRVDAQNVLEAMNEFLEEYHLVSVADLKAMIDKTSTHTDHKWGWEDLQGSEIRMTRGGYLLILPKTVPLD